jgi:hypothetical protein
MVQDDAGGAVESAWGKDRIEGRGSGAEEVIGEAGRPRQRDFSPQVPEVLGAQKYHHALRRQLGPAGAFEQKGTVSLCMSLILISGRVFWSIYGSKEPLSRR